VTTEQKSRNDEPTEADAADESSNATDVGSTDVEATEATEDLPTEATDGDGTEPAELKRSGRLWSRISVAVLAVLLVASVGLSAWLYFFQYRVDQQTGPDAQGVALQAAKDGTVALLSYAPETLDKDLDAAKTHLTGDFLSYYTNFTDQVVRVAAKQKAVKTTATVARGAVSEMAPGTAKVLLFVNQITMSADRQEPSATSSSVLVTLTKVDNSWLISAFDPV
jgi:Mce-associated membrane protein